MIVLTGMPGSGKSVVAQHLCSISGDPLLDSDRILLDRYGDVLGPDPSAEQWSVFRALERELVLELAESERGVLALGGGAWMDPGVRELLLKRNSCVYLRCSVETLLARQVDRSRVMFRSGDPRTTLGELLMRREKEYELADLVVTVDHLSVAAVADSIAGSVADRRDCDAIR